MLLYHGPDGAGHKEFFDQIISYRDMRRILDILKSINCIETSNVKNKYFITKAGLALYLSIKNEVAHNDAHLIYQIYKKAWKQWQDNKLTESFISHLKDQKRVLKLICESNGISIETISKKTGIPISEVIDLCEHFLKRNAVRIKKIIGSRDEMYVTTDETNNYTKKLVEVTRDVRKEALVKNLKNMKKIAFPEKHYSRWTISRGDISFNVDEEYKK